MAIQVRRGLKKDFDPYKMLPGEWAVSIDAQTQNQIVWMCFAAGVVKRMGTYEDFMAQIQEIEKDIADYFYQAFQQFVNEKEEYIQGKVDNDWIPAMQALVDNAAVSEKAAASSASAAATSELNANASALNAADSASTATEKATDATNSAESASTSADTATNKASEASDYANISKSYAVGDTGTRTGEDADNSKYYYEQAKRISQGLEGALLPMGTISFEQLATAPALPGYMYNISNDFISDDRFKDGGGLSYGAGSNVYYTADEMWDVLATHATDLKALNGRWFNTDNGNNKFVLYPDGRLVSNNIYQKSTDAMSEWKGIFFEDTVFNLHYKVSSEKQYDKLTITLDGTTIVNAISGEVEDDYSTTLSAGVHTLKATYHKDSSTDSNEDRAYLKFDNVMMSASDFSYFGRKIYYGTCNASASTVAKTATIADWTLDTGNMVILKFINGNTASSPTLNINSSGAKGIHNNGSSIGIDAIEANGTYLFVYDGTYFNLVGSAGSSGDYLPLSGGIIKVEGIPYSYGPDNALLDYTIELGHKENDNDGAIVIHSTVKDGVNILTEDTVNIGSVYGIKYGSNKYGVDGITTESDHFHISLPYANGYNQLSFTKSSNNQSLAVVSNSSFSLGTSAHKWKEVYAVNGTIQTSDVNAKTDIEKLSIDKVKEFIMGIETTSYKMIDGTSGRTHWGMLSNNLENKDGEVLILGIEGLLDKLGWKTEDFAGFIKSPHYDIEEYEDEDGETKTREVLVEGKFDYALRYVEFLPGVIVIIQDHEGRIVYIEFTIQKHEEEINSLKEQVNKLTNEVSELKSMVQQLLNR